MSQTINEFRKIDTDTDNLRIKQDSLRDALNINILNVKGQGFIVTNQYGNELTFSLSDGFQPLGYKVYNGITYICSVNTITQKSEIGCFPRPMGDNSGFVREYKALQILEDGIGRKGLTTSVLNFDVFHQIQMTIRQEFDDSVNLYITDFKNPIRSINSCFDQSGRYTSTKYKEEDLITKSNLILDTAKNPSFELLSIEDGGNLMSGNIIYYLRYTDGSFNKTKFLSESGVVQLTQDNEVAQGIVTEGTRGTISTMKKVSFQLSNVDTSFKFFEIGYVRYFDDLTETFLIDIQYPITGADMPLTITGDETTIELDISDIIRPTITTRVAKTIEQIEGRLVAGNLKEVQITHPDLIDFANKIILSGNSNLKIPDFIFDTTDPTNKKSTLFAQYKDYKRTYDKTSYFRGEAYAFGIVFVFKDGSITTVYPCLGKDDFGTGIPQVTNEKGIYRFKNASEDKFFTDDLVPELKLMGIQFDMGNAENFYNSSDFLKNNVEGFYFVRGERKPNLIYQGSLVKCYIAPQIVGFSNGGKTGKSFPLYDGMFPWHFRWAPQFDTGSRYNASTEGYIKDNAYALFSPDYHFMEELQSGKYTIFVIGKNTIKKYQNSSYILQNHLTEIKGYDFIKKTILDRECIKILDFDAAEFSSLKFVSKVEWGANDTSSFTGNGLSLSGLYLTWRNKGSGLLEKDEGFVSNLPMATGKYIGIDIDDNELGISLCNHTDRFLVNIYRNNPSNISIADLYDIKNTKYYKISGLIKINNLQTNYIQYQGDCFLQRTYLKTLVSLEESGVLDNFETNEARSVFTKRITLTCDSKTVGVHTTPSDANGAGGGGAYRSFGHILGMVTENAVNTAMRFKEKDISNPDSEFDYYPSYKYSNPLAFAVEKRNKESKNINLGNSKLTSLITHQGFDSLAPLSTGHYHVRLIISNLHLPGSITDAYRIFDLAAYKDYDYRLGEIINLINLNGKLFSIQENGVNIHFINERAVLPPGADSAQLVIGAGEILSGKFQNITDSYGSQHQWSIISNDNFIYGVDFNKRLIWRVSGQGFERLSEQKFINTKLHEILEQYDDKSDILQRFVDNPVGGDGISVGYDLKNKRVLFSFMFRNNNGLTPFPADTLKKDNDTLCFNENTQEFETRFDYNSPFYILLNEDLYSVNPDTIYGQVMDPQIQGIMRSDFYLHDSIIVPKLNFYGKQKKWLIKFVVNQYPEVSKIFDRLEIKSGDEKFTRIIFKGEDGQTMFIDPSTATRLPHIATRKEGKWYQPIPKIRPIPTSHQISKAFRGGFLEITLEYSGQNPIFVKSIETFFRQSKV